MRSVGGVVGGVVGGLGVVAAARAPRMGIWSAASAARMARSVSLGSVPSSTSHASLMASRYDVTSARILFRNKCLPQMGHFL